MVSGITSFLTSPALSNIAQSTTSSVTLETTMKAVGRPSFILADKSIDSATKRYAATKEFLYQATCLAVYMLLVVPVFRGGAFKLAKKMFKDEKAFSKFKDAKEYLNYQKLSKLEKNERLTKLKNEDNSKKLSEDLLQILKQEDKPDTYPLLKGSIELGNIIGSVVGLAIFAPQISHLVIHPVLKVLGFEKNKNNN